jgi:hypothetical protein
MKFTQNLIILFSLVAFMGSANAVLRPDNEIPPEGYFEADGRLILPLRKVISGIKLIAKDMGSAYAGCPEIRQKLTKLKKLLDIENTARLAERGITKDEYLIFWEQAHKIGRTNPVPKGECNKEDEIWQKMLENTN